VARASFKMPEDFLLKVSKLNEKTDDILPKVLEAGGEVMAKKVKSNLSSVIGKNTKLPSRSTGELLGALGVSPALIDRNGNYMPIKADNKMGRKIDGVATILNCYVSLCKNPDYYLN